MLIDGLHDSTSDDFLRQLRAVGRSVPTTSPTPARAATTMFRLAGLNAALRYPGETMLTPRIAANIAKSVSQNGHREFQKMMSIIPKQTSSHPRDNKTRGR